MAEAATPVIGTGIEPGEMPVSNEGGPHPTRGRWGRTAEAVRGRLAELDRRFYLGLVVIAMGGLVLRIGMILARPSCPAGIADPSSCFSGANDAGFYHDQANLFADHVWFRSSNGFDVPGLIGSTHPTAFHPPFYSVYLGVVSWFGGHSITSHRAASAALGAVTIVLIGVLGRKLAGRRAGWIAAGLAALYPAFWINDIVLMSESMYALVLVVVALLAYRLWEQPSRGRVFALGAAIGVAALTRSEAVLLLPLVALPLALGARGVSREARINLLVTATVALVLVLGPWVAFNLSRFEEPTFLSTSAGTFLNLGNCDETYYEADQIGFPYPCDVVAGQPALALLDESQKDAVLRDRSVAYIRDNLGRAPLVAAARVGRTFGLWQPSRQVEVDWRFENRGRAPSATALLAYYAALPLAAGAGIMLWRRRVAVSPLVGLIALSVIAVAGVAALSRVRIAADVAIVVLAAVGIEALLRRYFSRRGGLAFEGPAPRAPRKSGRQADQPPD